MMYPMTLPKTPRIIDNADWLISIGDNEINEIAALEEIADDLYTITITDNEND